MEAVNMLSVPGQPPVSTVLYVSYHLDGDACPINTSQDRYGEVDGSCPKDHRVYVTSSNNRINPALVRNMKHDVLKVQGWACPITGIELFPDTEESIQWAADMRCLPVAAYHITASLDAVYEMVRTDAIDRRTPGYLGRAEGLKKTSVAWGGKGL